MFNVLRTAPVQIFNGRHRRTSSVNFGGKTFLPENMCAKNYKMPELCVMFARKINKSPKFYVIIAPKYFLRFFFLGGGARATPTPRPRLLRL